MARRLSGLVFVALLGLAVLFGGKTTWADNVDTQIQAHLQAGEFGPAADLAQRAGTAAEADRRLEIVARAQASAGARGAALKTVGQISDDRVRASVLDAMGPAAARGGAELADFDSLIELIMTTVGVPTPGWAEEGGLEGAEIKEFPGGVYVDSVGMLKKVLSTSDDARLAAVYQQARTVDGNVDVRRESNLRKVSLTRLEKQIQLSRAAGKDVNDVMRNFAGLREIKYVLVYPESGDIVLAGPAGDWRPNAEGRNVSRANGKPVYQLDDFVVLLRSAMAKDGVFGCSITPKQENLAKTQAFLAESAKKPIAPKDRNEWLEKVRSTLGSQDIEVFGINPTSRVAQVIVEADYRMKLVGMGLEEGTAGVESYLDSIKLAKGEAAPAMDVLRWWFTIDYDSVNATKDRNAFAFSGKGIKVLSENELLNARGQRIHTGKSDDLNAQFARSFTKNFDALATKYPVYAELKNVFDLALVAAVVRAEDLPGRTGWHMCCFGDNERFPVAAGVAPKEVDTVINHRVVNKRTIIAGVSGGVRFDAKSLVKRDSIQVKPFGEMDSELRQSTPKALPSDAWWWD